MPRRSDAVVVAEISSVLWSSSEQTRPAHAERAAARFAYASSFFIEGILASDAAERERQRASARTSVR